MVGGRDQLNNLLVNARQYVPADEVETMNELLANPRTAKMAVRQIQEYQRQATGSTNSRPLASGNTPSSAAEGIANQRELWKVNRAAAKGDKNAQERLLAFMRNGRQFSG
jgi:hypothetical protein